MTITENVQFSGECRSCKVISGEKPISPGPLIHEGRFWVVDHAYPSQLKGWLVLSLKRHAEALHELTEEEFVELAGLQVTTVQVLHEVLDCEKEYLACFSEAAGFHLHIHVIPKPKDLPDDARGPRVFSMLKTDGGVVVPREEVKECCKMLRGRFG